MGKSQEVKDFLAGFTGGFKMMDDSFYKAALSDYYRKGGKGGGKGLFGKGGSLDDDKPNWLQRMFGAEEKKYDSPAEEGLAALKEERDYYTRIGDPDKVGKIDAAILKHGKIHGLGQPSAAPSASPAPKATAPAPKAVPETSEPETKVYPSEKPATDNIFKTSADSEEEPVVRKAALDDADAFDTGSAFDDVTFAEEGGYIAPEQAIPDLAQRVDESSVADDDPDFDVTQKMAQAATPGIDAGLRRIQAQFAPQAGLPDADPNVANGAAALARNENAATAEEVDAIDRVIDPEGKLPASAKSAARIAAVWDFYSKTDPDRAADLAQRLMLHDKQNSQTRGALAMQAIEQGDFASAGKFIQDGYNKDVPGGGMIQKAVLRDDGNFDVTARTEEGTKTFTAPKEMIVQVANDMANGKGWTQEVIDQAARGQAAIAKPKGAGRGSPVDNQITSELFEARSQLRQAQQSNDPKAISAAQANVAAVEQRALQYAAKQKNPAQTARNMGINPNPTTRATTVRSDQPKPSEKERAASQRQGRVDTVNKFIDNADSLEQAGVSVVNEGPRTGQAIPVDGSRRASEATRVEEARRSIEPIRNSLERERAAIGYDQAPAVGKKDSTFDDRSGPESAIMDNIRGFVRAKMQKEGDKPAMDPTQQREFARLADRVVKKNDVDPGQVVEFLWGAQNDLSKPVKVDRRSGRVQFGSAKLFVDPDTLTEIAAARGRKMQEAIGDRNKKWNEETDAYWQREQDELIRREASQRENTAPQLQNKKSEDPKVQLRERGVPTSSDYKRREEEARRRRDQEDDYGIPSR